MDPSRADSAEVMSVGDHGERFGVSASKEVLGQVAALIAGPDYMLGSVSAVTSDGILVAASATASQLGPYASGGGKVILVVGSQKIVPDLDAALRRIREYILPWEDAQVRPIVPTGSFVGKILLIEREWVAGRITVVLVQQPVGI